MSVLPHTTSRDTMFNRASLSEQVETALRQEITVGRLRPGQRINSSDYLTNWNVSVTPFQFVR